MMRPMILGVLLAAPLPAQAQEAPGRPTPAAEETPGRFMLEAGIDGGNSIACPGHYVGVKGRVAGPVSVYANVDNFRCVDVVGTTSRGGLSVRIGRGEWLLRPALRTGLAYDGTDVSHTFGASLTLGRRYGGRVILDRQPLADSDDALVLFQIGGYISF